MTMINFHDDKIAEIDAVCKEVGISRDEYIDRVFTWSKWIIARSRERRKITALDPMDRTYRELQDPILERLGPPKEQLN